jgi:hypothetical protein
VQIQLNIFNIIDKLSEIKHTVPQPQKMDEADLFKHFTSANSSIKEGRILTLAL